MENAKQTSSLLVRDYKMGFISAQEFILRYIDILHGLGAEKDLVDAYNEVSRPLADFLVDITNGSGKSISDFDKSSTDTTK